MILSENRSPPTGRARGHAFRKRALFLLDQILAERCCRRKLLAGGLYISPFAGEIFRNRPAQARIGDEMGGIGRVRQVAARQLVFALRAGLDPLELVGDRIVDGLVIAELEMQERVVLERAPIAAIKRVRPDEVCLLYTSPSPRDRTRSRM